MIKLNIKLPRQDMSKHNLNHLHFSVWSDLADKPLRDGPHQAIYEYLKKYIKNKVVGDLEIAARDEDKEKNFSLKIMSIDKWLEWWERFALPGLLENDFNDDLMIEYPDAGINDTEL